MAWIASQEKATGAVAGPVPGTLQPAHTSQTTSALCLCRRVLLMLRRSYRDDTPPHSVPLRASERSLPRVCPHRPQQLTKPAASSPPPFHTAHVTLTSVLRGWLKILPEHHGGQFTLLCPQDAISTW